MSDHIPFEIQSEIMKRLPVKSLVQFRSVSKQWKFFIDCPKFIKTYHINHPNPQPRVLLYGNKSYTSIIDDNTFPKQKFPISAREPLDLLRNALVLGSVSGLVYFYGQRKDIELKTFMVVLWNPSIRKCVAIPIPNGLHNTRIGFGVCLDTNDLKLVKINIDTHSRYWDWEVQVFTLSSRVWKTVYTGPCLTLCSLIVREHVSIDGIIYWSTSGSFIPSFDLKSEKFSELSIPERFVHKHAIWVAKVNESLGLLDYYYEGNMSVCGVWMRKDGVNQPFTKIYTVKVEGKSVFSRVVLGFRNNGEVLLQLDDDNHKGSHIEVYEPSSGRINSVGISGDQRLAFDMFSYMETLLLLDDSNSIIH